MSNRTWFRGLGLAVAWAALVPLWAQPAAAAGRQPVTDLATGGQTGYATVVQTPQGVSFDLHTSGLVPGHAYTVWVMVFNHPEFCSHPARPGLRCGLEDMPYFGLPGDPRNEFSVAYGAGHVVGTSGPTAFAGRWNAGDTSGVVLGAGLLEPEGAEVQLRVRDHGPATPGYIDAQTHTFNGGCEAGEPNEGQCADVQTSGL